MDGHRDCEAPARTTCCSSLGPNERLPSAKALLGDRGCDAGWFRQALADRGIAACIPSKADRKVQIPHDAALYRQRHKIEIIFGHLKDWRRIHSFKLSNDRAVAEKLHDVVGLYVSPPAHAIVLSVDEKSQIQALDRTQPGLPLKRGRGATMTHDYKRNGTTTLFAALNVLDGSVIGRNMQRHRHQEFIRFLNAVEAELPPDKAVHVILDNYATHKQPRSAPGWPAIRAGPSTSCPHRVRG